MSDTLASCESVSLGKLVLRLDRNGAFAREISVGGEELFRGIGFVVRDANWGTPVLTSDAILSRQNDRATVKSGGELDMSGGDLTWSAEWSITEGGLEAKGRASSVTGFHTNRTGFVVLHSLGATRGRPVKVFHSCGGIEENDVPGPRLAAPTVLRYRGAGIYNSRGESAPAVLLRGGLRDRGSA